MNVRHYEPLRPNRTTDAAERYEFTHGTNSVCVYDINTMAFVKEIPVGTKPDCHATSLNNKYLYIACFEGLYCIDQDLLEVVKIVDTGKVYATNTLPDGDTLLVHDLRGGIQLIKNINDMEKIHVHNRVQVIENGVFRCEIGGKGHFIQNGKYYLVGGWHQKKMYLFDTENDFSFVDFISYDPLLDGADDLVINTEKTKAYTACHQGHERNAYVAVVDIANKKVIKTIPTGVGTCGLTMTNDERYVVASNDQDDSISVIDTQTDTVVNTPCARKGFEALGLRGYIQGISCGKDNSIFVYGCSGNGALVRFYDVAEKNRYVISYNGGMYLSEE